MAMLDARHANLPKPPTDPNAYTLGAIGDHNIVIACLPKGKYGTVSASVVASNMASTFPAIRFGLMVGIGGGIPPNVRLGDVVVSVPVDQSPGVVQWDLGKAEEGGAFRRTGLLNNPPTSLLTVLTQLESEHEMMGPGFPQYLEELATKFPRLASKYAKSNQLQDILFDKDYPHASCTDDTGQDDSCASCDKSRSVKQEPRDAQVHYGLIASGNQVIKDAMFRESLVKELGGRVLCVEMEAAGLMDNFPCIVIRGICDYADSHKNKAWQEHAAAVAAAFTKELLGYVTVAAVTEEKSAKDILSHIDRTVESIKEVTMDTRQLINKQEDMEILTWLSETHYGAQQSDILKHRHSKTGRWFLGSREYRDWFNTKRKTLFCPGIPGAGKTIMAATVINDISRHMSPKTNFGLAYVYFTFSQQREQTVEHVLASLLMQFLHRQASLPQQIRDLYTSHKKNGTRPSRHELLDHLNEVVSSYKRTFIVLDALDECSTSSQCRTKVLHDVTSLQTRAGINILATSRMVDEIASRLRGQSLIMLPIKAQKVDIKLVLRSQMKIHDKDLLNEVFRNEVATKVAKTAKGMFLLAQLQLDALLAMPTRGKIKRALEGLTSGRAGLHAVYELAMKRIESQGPESNELAKTILLWIVHARTPLSARQLQHALGVTPNAEAISEDDIPTIRTLLSVCAGLVTIDVASNNIRLIHYTTQEYFQQTQGRWFPDAQRQITRTCVKYLSYKSFSVSSQSFYDIDMQQGVHSFYQYAALEWGHHAGASPAMPEVIDFLLHTEQENRTIYSCESLDGIYLGIAEVCPGRVSALNVAIHFGLIYAVPALLGGYYGSTVDRWHATLIAHATGHGQAAVVKLLLEIATTGVDDKTYYGTTPLGQAAEMGYTEVVQLLLDTRRVDINTKNQAGQTPLALAAKTGHVEVVKLLLATGRARIDDKDRAGQTPLALAAESGHCDIMRLLLETGEVDVNSKDGFRRTPLATAASKGHDQVVGLLIGIDSTDIDVKDVSNSTPLALAAESGNLKAVELLTKTGKVDMYSKNWAGYAPWAQAVKAGHKEVAEMLLKIGRFDMPTTEIFLFNDFDIDGQSYTLPIARPPRDHPASFLDAQKEALLHISTRWNEYYIEMMRNHSVAAGW